LVVSSTFIIFAENINIHIKNHMEQELVSIIVTVYNIENYLPHCLNSISKQTYKELEIVLVDDGSTDSSGIICDQFALQDSRCRVIHQINQGACMARNVGKKEAKGNYLFFMDGDDYMHPETIHIMYETINSNNEEYDISIIGHKRTNNFNEEMPNLEISHNYCLNGYELMEKLMGGISDMELAGYCWNKLYRKSAIESLLFRQYVPVEDFDFNLRVFLKLRKAIVTPLVLYYYVQRPTSLVNSPKKSWFVWSRLVNLLYKNYQDLTDKERLTYAPMLVEKLYFIMLFYKETAWKTSQQNEAFSLCRAIEKSTISSFIFNKRISPIKKTYRLLLLHSPRLTRIMMQLRGWKR
jgi:glycosyltransferase involved in cell wall biosynthesis